ncbi:MAG TPA: SpoIIE family protein phosphatase [Acidimicrobiia bacterium]|nr:SpoIIE family protein phosphatase [Acidimicrobiia bacterium]
MLPADPSPGQQRWLLAPGDRNLGRVWITVVFAVLTVAGVAVVTVVGVRSGEDRVEMVERGGIAVDLAARLRDAVEALQDERGVAEMWLTNSSVQIRESYVTAQESTDQALDRLRAEWQVRGSIVDDNGPPVLADIDEATEPLNELRDATLRFREGSTVEAYSAVISVVISSARRVEGVAAGSPLSARVRAEVRLLETGEALARQRDVVLGVLAEGEPLGQDEIVRLLLLQQEARTNLSSLRFIEVDAIAFGVGDFLSAMNTDDVSAMLASLRTGDERVDPGVWFQAASERLASLRSLGDIVESDLVTTTDDLRSSAETMRLLQTVGLTALLAVSVLAGLAAVGAARERARALDEHRQLAAGLFEWFLPARLIDVEGVRIAARYDAASEFTRAGGDWYDVYHVSDGRVALTIGDVAGHGAAATAQMAQARNLLRGIALAAEEPSPSHQIARLDAALRGSDTMATIFHGLLDLARNQLVYTRAGHLPGLVRHGAGVEMLAGALGSPVGVSSEGGYSEAVITLVPPWQIVLFTDGLVEERGGADIEQSVKALAASLAAATTDADDLADSLIESRPRQLDDAAVLIVALEGPAAGTGDLSNAG